MFIRNRTKKILAALTRLDELNTERAELVAEMGAHVERLEEQVEALPDRDTVDELVNEKVESAVDTDDITEEVTTSYTFTSAVESAVSDELDGMSAADFGFDMDTLVSNAIHAAIEDGSLLALIAEALTVTVAPAEDSEIKILDNPTEEVPA
jgi:hypothetical protein